MKLSQLLGIKLKGITLVGIGDRDVSIMNLSGEVTTITSEQARLMYRPLQWLIYMIVNTTNSKGEEELKIDTSPTMRPYRYSEITQYMNNRHNEFIDDLESKNVRINYTAWIAKPAGRELTLEEIDTIVSAKYEFNKTMEEVE